MVTLLDGDGRGGDGVDCSGDVEFAELAEETGLSGESWGSRWWCCVGA